MQNQDNQSSVERLKQLDEKYNAQETTLRKQYLKALFISCLIIMLFVLILCITLIPGLKLKLLASVGILVMLISFIISSHKLIMAYSDKLKHLYSDWMYEREEGRLTGVAAEFVNNHRIDITDCGTFGADERSDNFLSAFNSTLASLKDEGNAEKFNEMIAALINVNGYIATGKVLTDHYLASEVSHYLHESYYSKEVMGNAIPISRITPAGKNKLKYTLKHDKYMNPVFNDYPGESYDIIHIISVSLNGKELNDDQLARIFARGMTKEQAERLEEMKKEKENSK